MQTIYLTPKQIADDVLHCTRQTIFNAIARNHLKVTVIKTNRTKRFYITKENVIAYQANRWSHRKKVFNGGLMYGENEMNAKEVGEKLGLGIQQIYYLARSGRMSHVRKNYAYVFNADSLNYTRKRKPRKTS